MRLLSDVLTQYHASSYLWLRLLLGKFQDKQARCWVWQNFKTLNRESSVIQLHNPFNCYLDVSVALTISHQASRDLSQSSLMKLALIYVSSLLVSTSIDWPLMRLQTNRMVQKMWFVAIWCDTDLFTLCRQGRSHGPGQNIRFRPG